MHASPQYMHIPDGFLSVTVSLVMWLVSLITLAYALKKVNEELSDRLVPQMGILAACIFAGQMLNFTVAGGTSGHLIGAALATIVLGPWAGIVVMTCVIGIQALIFQDGGLLALGANLFNMGIVGVTVSYFTYRSINSLLGKKPGGLVLGQFLSAWLSVFVASLSCSLQLAISGTSPINIVLPVMAGIHALIGVGEGLITVGALAFFEAALPTYLSTKVTEKPANKVVWVAGMLIALALVVISPLASAHPDGLEWVAERQGFLDNAQAPLFEIIPDYLIPGVSSEAYATILAGVAGIIIVLGITLILFVAQKRKKRYSS
jgi:cobalt/nickel transport system permease protein